MPVSPMYNNGGYGNGMFGGDYMFWFVILILAMNGGWGNGFGNNAGGMMPYMMNNNTNSDVQRGFDMDSTQSDYERQQILETIKSIEQREMGR